MSSSMELSPTLRASGGLWVGSVRARSGKDDTSCISSARDVCKLPISRSDLLMVRRSSFAACFTEAVVFNEMMGLSRLTMMEVRARVRSSKTLYR